MAKYMVAYDLVGTDETSGDYKQLIEKIQTFPWWGKLQKSAWVIKTSDSAAQVRSALAAHMDSDDRLFVAALTGETAWTKVLCDEAQLKAALTSP